ncbi:hypothetical protein ACFX14_026896 [Malus domestica]
MFRTILGPKALLCDLTHLAGLHSTQISTSAVAAASATKCPFPYPPFSDSTGSFSPGISISRCFTVAMSTSSREWKN